MVNYKIRKEKNGAYLFNKDNGKVTFIPEEVFEELKGILNCEIIYPKIPLENLPEDCFSAPSKVYFEVSPVLYC